MKNVCRVYRSCSKKSYVINIDKTEKTSMDNNKTVFLANAGGGGGGGGGK